MPGKKESSASNPNKNILAYVNELELFLDPLFTPRVNKDGSLAMGLTATQLLYLIRWADEKLPYQPRRIMHSLDYDREPQMAEYSRLIKKLKAANPVLRPQTPATKYESDRRTQRNPRSKPSCMRYVPDAPHTGEVTDKQSEPKFGGRKVKKQKNNDAKKGRGREDVDKEDSESECETQEYMRENARVIGWKCVSSKATQFVTELNMS